MKLLRLFRFIVLPVFCTFGISDGETHLSGFIDGMTLESDGNPYIVSDSIVIQEGTTVTIKSGCILLFNNYSGIVIDGAMQVEGTSNEPVIFTTVNDSNYSEDVQQLANPFDWNGIYITQKASNVQMAHFVLAYSVYGIKSEKEVLTIEHGVFRVNGQYNVVVKGSIKPAIDERPFNYGVIQIPDATTLHSSQINGKEQINVDKPVQQNNNLVKSNPLELKGVPIAIGSAGMITAIACAVSLIRFSGTQEKFSKERDGSMRNELEKKGTGQLAAGIITGGISCIAIPVSVVFYIRNNSKFDKSQNISLLPLACNHCGGIVLSTEF